MASPLRNLAERPEPIEDRTATFVAAIETMLGSLSATERDQVLKIVSQKLRPNPRAGEVLGTVIQLFRQKPEWAAEDLREEVPKQGVQASAKEIYNALGYLKRHHRIRKVGYGQYVLADIGAGIDMNDEDDRSGPTSEHFS